jgi:hypothetical protein
MKTYDLTGAALDYWVAKAEGHLVRSCGDGTYWNDTECGPIGVTDLQFPGETYFSPSTLWEQGGPIIQREHIAIRWDDETLYGQPQNQWLAEHRNMRGAMAGPQPLIAAMRAYVASKFGEDVPDDGNALERAA